MRAFLVSATAALFFAAAPAAASVITLGSTYAESCYFAAEDRNPSRNSLDACDRALTEEGLTRENRIGTHVNRGILHMIAGDYARANRDYDAALRLEHDTPEAWLNKGIAHFQMGDSDEALALADKALQLGTRKPALAHYLRGLSLENAGRVREAYAALVRARDLAPKWSEPRLELTRYRVR